VSGTHHNIKLEPKPDLYSFGLLLAMAKLPAPTDSDKVELALTADVTLTSSSPVWNFVTPDADGWIITLPASATYGIFVFHNSDATYSFEVEDADDVSLGTIGPGESGWFALDAEVTP
jgi:hypothetical protein